MTNRILLLIIIIGISIRLFFQFITPTFNVDEISLGDNIKNLNYSELLFPLKNFQSAPPLYLIIQKSIFNLPILPLWVKAKLLSTIVSILILTSKFFIN